jgi:hypothetical protein
MAWLLHEPRLIASVPVFCIIAVKPLVFNRQAPIFVSTGAVKLLKYLHTRLEALIQDQKPTSSLSGSSQSSNNRKNMVHSGSHHEDEFEDNTALNETSAAVWKVSHHLPSDSLT